MQRNIRKASFFVSLPVAAIALALFVMSLGNGVSKVHAAVDSFVNFSISSSGCDSDGTATCNVAVGGSFSVAFNITSLPSNGEYAMYVMAASWTAGLTGPPPGVGSPGVHQLGAGNWPACVVPASNSVTATTANATCGTQGNPTSTYVGALLHMDFACPGTAGMFTISLRHGDYVTSVNSFAGATYSEAALSAHEDLTVNCVPPSVGGISIDPNLAGGDGGASSSGFLLGGSALAALLLGAAAWRMRKVVKVS